MSVTIDSLDIQIRSSAGSAATNIDELARSLTNLKSAGSLTKVTNNLNKLATSLAGLKSNSEGLAGLNAIASAMQSLSTIQKPSGMNSALNSLKKIPEVLAGLDDTVLDTFAVKMQQLSAALAPLATQIDKVATSFAKLPSQVSKTVTATNKMAQASNKAASAQRNHNDSLDKGSINLAAAIANIRAYMGTLRQIVGVMKGFVADAIEWDGIQFRFGRAFGEDAEDVYNYILKINDALKINTQQFMQYSSLYGSLLSGFGMAQEKVTTISVGLTELSYDIWAAYNDRYKTLEDASEAVRSAITGEIEPIRNAGIALTEASMQEYLDSIGMAEVKMQNLSEAQKAEVRYAVMVNSAMQQGIVGTYAREMVTAEGAVRTLSQQLKGLGQAIGSLFIPILSAAIPWISAFVEILYDAVAAVAAFFGISFFEIDWGTPTKGAGSGLDNIADSADNATGSLESAGEAAKKLKDYTMGFDELNVISPDTGSSGGGGSGGGAGGAGGNGFPGLDLDTLWDNSIFDQASDKVDELKQKIKTAFEEWKTEIAIIGASLAAIGIASLLSQLGRAVGLGDKFLNTMQTIKKIAATAIIITIMFSLIKGAFENFMGEDGTIFDYIKGLLVGGLGTWLLYSMWGPGGLVLGLGVTAAASLSAIIENGGINSVESAVVALTGLASSIGAVKIAWDLLKKSISGSNFEILLGWLREGGNLGTVLSIVFPKLSAAISKVIPAITGAASSVGGFLAGISAPVWIGIALAILGVVSVIVFLKEHWDEVTAAAKNFFETNIVPKLESIKESWEKIKTALSDVKEAFLNAIPPEVKEALEEAGEWIGNIVQKIGELLGSIDVLKAVGAFFEWLGGIIVGVLGGAVSGAISVFVSAIENVVEIVSGAIQTVSGFVELIIALFTGGDVEAAADKMISGIGDIFDGLWGLVTDPIEEFWNGVVDWFTSLWDELVGHSIVPDMIDDIVDWFLGLPGKVLGKVGDFVGDVVEEFSDLGSSISEKFSSAWETVKGWWSGTKPDLEEYTPEIGSIKEKASSAWNTAKSWYDNKKSKWKEYTPTIGNIKDKVSGAWDTAKSWYDNKKSKLAEYTPSIGSIKEKVSDAWGTAKSWYDDKKSALKEYTPSIGSIKNKVSTAWSSARDWYDNKKTKLKEYTPSIGSIYEKVKERWNNARDWYNTKKAKLAEYTPSIGSIYAKVKERWDNARSWYNSKKAAMSTYTPSIGSIKDKLVSAWNTAKTWWNKNVKLSIPSLSFKVTYSNSGLSAVQKAIVKALGLAGWPKLSFAANGGMFDQGSLIWAGERGAEIAANAPGGKTGIMNVQQMQDAVYEGVYAAIAAAIKASGGSGGGTQAVNVYLDGRLITRSVEKTQRERGASIMGNQVYGY